MSQMIIDGATIDLNEQGYLTDMSQWTSGVAHKIAEEEGIALEDKHFEVINYLRDQHASDARLSIRRIGKSGLVTIKEFYALFPGGPLKKASRIAGIPKPASCV